jgi:Sugar (pentulose and hexulose) kinases
MADYMIAVDIGTQGTKAVLFDTELHSVAAAFEESRLIRPEPGTVWQEGDDLYFSVVRTIRELMEKTGVPAGSILAVGIDGQMAGILGIGADGLAVTCYDSWLDTRCGGYVELMRSRAGSKVTEITGGPVTYTHGPKILWWKGEHPEAYRKIEKFVLPHGYVAGRMCGLPAEEYGFDYTCLQYSGFGDNYAKAWSEELLETFGVDKNKMARIVSPFDVLGKTTAEFAEQSGLISGIPVVAGAGDTAASVFGAGLFDKDCLLDCAGTASVLCSAVDSYAPDTRFGTMTMMRSPVDGFWFPLSYINGGGMCVRWFRDEFTGNPPVGYAELEAKAGRIPPGSEGLIFVPHFAGRVLPGNPQLKGSFVGLDWKHTREHLFRAVMEGIAYEYDYYLSVLKSLYPSGSFRRMKAIGGGAKSELFLSIKADVLGVPVSSYDTGDTALVGSAVIAGVGTGVFSDYRLPIQKTLREKRMIQPDLANHAAYRDYAHTYLKIIEALTPVYEKEPPYAKRTQDAQ